MNGTAYGIDLGFSGIKLCDIKQNRIWKEEKEETVLADGRIESAGGFQRALERILPKNRGFFKTMDLCLSVGPAQTEIERAALTRVLKDSSMRVREVCLVERGLAVLAGSREDYEELPGITVMDLGAGNAEISILSYGRLVTARTLPFGGDAIGEAVISAVRSEFGIWLDKKQAGILWQTFGLSGGGTQASLILTGQEVSGGKKVRVQIPGVMASEAVKNVLAGLMENFYTVLKGVPPEIRENIMKNGICLAGGVSLLKGIVPFLEEKTGIKAVRIQDPDTAALKGIIQMKKSILNV